MGEGSCFGSKLFWGRVDLILGVLFLCGPGFVMPKGERTGRRVNMYLLKVQMVSGLYNLEEQTDNGLDYFDCQRKEGLLIQRNAIYIFHILGIMGLNSYIVRANLKNTQNGKINF